jgi:putative ABC transport system substrate-binding protein
MTRDSRRRFVVATAALAAIPISTRGQTASGLWRIGFLTNGTVVSTQGQLDAFVQGLREQGWNEGKTYVIEARYADGNLERMPGLAADVVAQGVDMVFAPSGIAALAAKKTGTALPIVFAFAPDPVGQGFGASLSRPGGTMTGLTSTHTELTAKRVELLREISPGLRRMAVLDYLAGAPAGVAEQLAETERAAKMLGVATVAEQSPGPDDFERALASLKKQQPDALIVIENPVFYTHRTRLVERVATMRIPAVYNVFEYVQAGGLMSYGTSYADLARRAAAYIVKIANGARPGDLPIERPTKLELSINLNAARALGLTIPPSVLLRADPDKVIG